MYNLGHNTKQFLIAIDQLANALLGLLWSIVSFLPFVTRKATKSWADETLSAHCWRIYITSNITWPCKLVNFLAFNKDHCYESFQSERLGRQLPPEERS